MPAPIHKLLPTGPRRSSPVQPTGPRRKTLRQPNPWPVLLLTAVSCFTGFAQSSRLPDAPVPGQPRGVGNARAIAIQKPISQNPAASGTHDSTDQEPQNNPGPDLTMFPHSQSARYWISGQSNTIFQAKPGFHSPYQGPNSLDNAGEYKTSLVETLFLGYQPHHNLRYNTDLLVDFESAEGAESAKRWVWLDSRTSTWSAIRTWAQLLTFRGAAFIRPSG